MTGREPGHGFSVFDISGAKAEAEERALLGQLRRTGEEPKNAA